ncbi:MAG: hypothetical protein ACOX5G_11225 [Kiritimatiellia bacterium]|jgi:hypothetical protein
MADETPTPIPPRQQPVPPATPPEPAAPPTIRLRRPGDPAPTIRPPAPAAPEAAEAAPAAPEAAPAAAAPAAPPPKSATTRIPLPDGAAKDAVAAAKSKTSRIPLEAALGVAANVGAAPKTIRLKRPGEAPAPIPVATPLGTAAASQTSRIPSAKLATARIPDAVAGEVPGDEAPLTRRKTIKVRRPGAVVAPRVSVGGGEGDASDETGGDETPWTAPPGSFPMPRKDTAHWSFIVAACLAILVILATCVVLAAQAWGPDASLTSLSSWPNGPDITLPGAYSK